MHRLIIAMGVALVAALTFAEPAEARRGRGYHRHHVSYHRVAYRQARRPTKSRRGRLSRYQAEEDDAPEPKPTTRLLGRCVMPAPEPIQTLLAPLDPRWPKDAASLNPLPRWDRR